MGAHGVSMLKMPKSDAFVSINNALGYKSRCVSYVALIADLIKVLPWFYWDGSPFFFAHVHAPTRSL